MSENVQSIRRLFFELFYFIEPTIHYTAYQVYAAYKDMNNFLFPPTVAMVIEMNYNKIDDILIDGKSITWLTHSKEHPLQNHIASTDDCIEIQYSNFTDKYRYIVQPGEDVEQICKEIIWISLDRREKMLILMAHYKNKDGDCIDITAELNDYTDKYTDEMITTDSFQWDKMYIDGIQLSTVAVYFMDWLGNDHVHKK